jgi:hypothetical protein
MRRAILVGLLGLLGPAAASAQVIPPVWDAPALIRPGAPSGFSLFVLEPARSNDLGALAYWRGSAAPTGFGFRGGIVEDAVGDAAGIVGIDVSGTLAAATGTGQPELLWWTGAGLGFGDEIIASFPLGVSVGWTLSDEGVTFSPNLGGHIALDVNSGPDDDIDIDGTVDLGIDVGFQNGFMVRFGAAVADRDAFGIGVRLPS